MFAATAVAAAASNETRRACLTIVAAHDSQTISRARRIDDAILDTLHVYGLGSFGSDIPS